ncbi:MAG: hypothetical protein EZS28_025015 [Streblomastix strix]|uniref:Uncharacterized protein n=1 Tax=Streblomastix strix TaxID=222440 RepID=A0A5J4VAA8_9EUKA|nr:MAG: hypothetical protein EZS28_025015 [Streblomastix strix]
MSGDKNDSEGFDNLNSCHQLKKIQILLIFGYCKGIWNRAKSTINLRQSRRQDIASKRQILIHLYKRRLQLLHIAIRVWSQDC